MEIIKKISLLFFSPLILTAQNDDVLDDINKYLKNRKIQNTEIIFVSIKKQKLFHIKNKQVLSNYIISTSKYGIGNKNGSNKTPTGLHQIKQKIGDKVPINGRMVGRVFTGEIAEIYNDNRVSKTDDITSRILWLDGLEIGVNKGANIDSFNRYIYIHGTSEEGRLGRPSSNGCIRMKNKDIIDLYKKIEVGTLVLIL